MKSEEGGTTRFVSAKFVYLVGFVAMNIHCYCSPLSNYTSRLIAYLESNFYVRVESYDGSQLSIIIIDIIVIEFA